MIKIEYPTMMPLARRIQKDTKRLDSDKLIGAHSYAPSNLTAWTKDPSLIPKIE